MYNSEFINLTISFLLNKFSKNITFNQCLSKNIAFNEPQISYSYWSVCLQNCEQLTWQKTG
jgi:hypothetical protein